MSAQHDAAKAWTIAMTEPTDEHLDQLRPHLARGVTTVSLAGAVEGADDVLASFGKSPLAALMPQARWTDAEVSGDGVTVGCTFASGAPVGGLTIRLSFEGNAISRAETTMVPAPPPPAVPVHLTDAMRDALQGALAHGTPVVMAYVDAAGQPHLSLRGTAQVYNETQLGVWARNPEGGLPGAAGGRAGTKVALLYRDPATRASYQFQGVAHVTDDAVARDTIFDNSPEVERNFDPGRRGAAILVDVTRVEGRDAGGPLLMSVDAG